MDKEIEVKSLKLAIGKREIDLTIEEARKLRTALDEIFGTGTIRHEHHYDRWWWPASLPIITYTGPDKSNGYSITCNNATGLIRASV